MVENVALTRTQTRTVEEVVLHLLGDEGGRVELPVAIVTDRNPDRTLKAIRVYHSMWPLTGEHALRPPLLPADSKLHAQGVVGDYQRALAEGDLESIVETFEPDGYAREPSGGAYIHRGAEGLRELYAHLFANGGGIPWSTAPSLTMACGAPSSTTACAGELLISCRRRGWQCTSEGTAGCSGRRASTTTSLRLTSPTPPPYSRTFPRIAHLGFSVN